MTPILIDGVLIIFSLLMVFTRYMRLARVPSDG